MNSKQFFLQRFPGPIRKYRILHVQNGLIEEGHNREDSNPDVLQVIAAPETILLGGLKGASHLSPERFGVRHALTVRPEALNDGEDFLKDERQVIGAQPRYLGHGGRGS